VAHYGEQNGDLMRDPEICFVVSDGVDGLANWTPLYFRNDYVGAEHEVITELDDGRKGVPPQAAPRP
jgi:hypothetical protein